MDFSYIGSGSLIFNGCAVVTFTVNLISKFQNNITLYIIAEAELEGELRPVHIKKILFNDISNPAYSYVTLYVDTFNRIWAENELCIKNDAIDIAVVYEERQLEKQKKILQCLV